MSDPVHEIYLGMVQEKREEARQTLDITVFDITDMIAKGGYLSARGFVEELLDGLASVPEQYRDQIKFEYRPDGFGGIEECRAHYTRLETNAELESRREELRIRTQVLIEQQQRIAANKAAAERREYERLKEIYERVAEADTVAQL